jgi:hypothetical protein
MMIHRRGHGGGHACFAQQPPTTLSPLRSNATVRAPTHLPPGVPGMHRTVGADPILQFKSTLEGSKAT